jgi:hypothetical protein
VYLQRFDRVALQALFRSARPLPPRCLSRRLGERRAGASSGRRVAISLSACGLTSAGPACRRRPRDRLIEPTAPSNEELGSSRAAGAVWLGDERGRDSGRASPRCSLRKRSTHLATVFGVLLYWRATSALVNPLSTMADLSRSGEHSCDCPFGPPRIAYVWRLQRSRSGPNGQPPESSHLAVDRERYLLPVRAHATTARLALAASAAKR